MAHFFITPKSNVATPGAISVFPSRISQKLAWYGRAATGQNRWIIDLRRQHPLAGIKVLIRSAQYRVVVPSRNQIRRIPARRRFSKAIAPAHTHHDWIAVGEGQDSVHLPTVEDRSRHATHTGGRRQDPGAVHNEIVSNIKRSQTPALNPDHRTFLETM